MGFLGDMFTGIGKAFGGGKKDDTPTPAQLPTTPTNADAAAQAQEDIKKRRKMSMLNGGKTDITGGTGVVTGSNVLKNTLGGQ